MSDVAAVLSGAARWCVVEAAGCTLEQVTVDVYPPSPRGSDLRALRVALGMTLRGAADALGLRVVEVSGLEMGRYTLSDADWTAASDALRAVRAAP